METTLLIALLMLTISLIALIIRRDKIEDLEIDYKLLLRSTGFQRRIRDDNLAKERIQHEQEVTELERELRNMTQYKYRCNEARKERDKFKKLLKTKWM